MDAFLKRKSKVNRLILLLFGLIHASLFAQGSLGPPPPPLSTGAPPAYTLDFGTSAPPAYIGEVTYVTVSDNNLNFSLGYFTSPATSAWLAKRQPDGSLVPVFQMTPSGVALSGYGFVYAYGPGFPIMGNSAVRAADFRAGLWYALFSYGAVTYAAQLAPTPDTTPPLILGIGANPDVLWPPNHRMMSVRLTVDASDDQDPAPVAHIVRVTSNESDNPPQPDWEITGPLSLNLHAERLGKGSGRIYTITVECDDAAGNVSFGSVEVTVPHH
jgi:hypothetical protein